MTLEQITALSPLILAVIGAVTTVWYRLQSRAGKEIRERGAALEAALRYIHTLLRLIAAAGVPRSRIPRPPRELSEVDVWSDWTRTDTDDEGISQ
jgi:hypothetical protein